MDQTQTETHHPEGPEQPQSFKDNQQFAFFIQGYQLPPEEQLIRNRLLTHIPTLRTKTYRDSLLKIVSSFSQLDSFSDNLQKKVDNLLLAQQTAFVESYKHHINKIKHEFEQLNKQIQELQQKIRYYENQGQMSSLVKKVFQLEQQSSKLFKMIAGKDKKIRDLQLTITVLQREMKTMKDTVKSTVRQKSEILLKQIGLNTPEQQMKLKLEDVTVFATEPSKKVSTIKHQMPKVRQFQPFNYAEEKSISKSLTMDIKYQPLKSKEIEETRSKRLSVHQEHARRDISQLKQTNKKLVRENVRLVQQHNQLQEFFIKCVQELKKQIRIRKKMDLCTFQDFRKEDKLLLLIKVLSNDEILSFLHQRIFNKNSTNIQNKKQEQKTVPECSRGVDRLPKINFNLTYEKK